MTVGALLARATLRCHWRRHAGCGRKLGQLGAFRELMVTGLNMGSPEPVMKGRGILRKNTHKDKGFNPDNLSF